MKQEAAPKPLILTAQDCSYALHTGSNFHYERSQRLIKTAINKHE